MEKHLNYLHEEIVDIDPELARKSTQVLSHFIDLFILEMSNNHPIIGSMNPRVVFLGSYFEGLKICAPDEFDVNIVLTLPYEEIGITMTAKNCSGSVTSISIPAEDTTNGLVASWCNQSGEISARRFRKWMISIGEKVVDSIKTVNVNERFYTVTLKDTGVAMTAVLTDQKDFSMSVDIVVVFQFSFPKVPLRCQWNLERLQKSGIIDYFLVPLEGYDWRITLSSQEKSLLEGRNCKRSMKLVKYICQTHRIEMFSYVIKTLFLRSAVKSSRSLTDQVIGIIETFRRYFISGVVPNYWFPEDNLVADIPKDTLESWSAKLTKTLDYLRSDSELCFVSFTDSVILITE